MITLSMGVGLGLTDVHAAQRIGLDGVDDMHRKAVISQMRVERQPVVSRRFHAEHDRLLEATHHVHELVVTRLRIGKAHGLADDAPVLSDDGGLMVTLGNVNTDEQHRKHLEIQVADWKPYSDNLERHEDALRNGKFRRTFHVSIYLCAIPPSAGTSRSHPPSAASSASIPSMDED